MEDMTETASLDVSFPFILAI